MSWNVNFTLTRDEDGKAVLTVDNEFGAPEGRYAVQGHTLEQADWGESVGVVTPMGNVSASILNPAKRDNITR